MGSTAVALCWTLWQSSLAGLLNDFCVAYLSTEIAAFPMLSGRCGGSMGRVLTSQSVSVCARAHAYFYIHACVFSISSSDILHYNHVCLGGEAAGV